jgi:V/A-type H+-transporting ATPase subunit A
MTTGQVVRVAGPVVEAEGLEGVCLHDVVRVGDDELLGEVVRLSRRSALVQVYENTDGLRVGAPVRSGDGPFGVELGPGLLGGVYDGIQRLLPALAVGPDGPFARPFIARGAGASGLPDDRWWHFEPAVADGADVGAGDMLGTVAETAAVTHRILVPPGVAGVVTGLRGGPARVGDPIARVGGRPVAMRTRWPVRQPRPVARRLDPERPLVTGQRVIDSLFPVAKGGTATIPGGFGTGKTVLEQALARWADADVVVYVACGERGNELAEMLDEFPRLVDPRTGASLMDRTVLVANTSNMPVAAREASVYVGMTIAEYYRDQGYDVALLADSTSRWAEALREISGRLEEMPGEEGYPASLPARLAEFYERAGAVECLGRERRRGSVTVIGAVSPPAADFSEPVTQYSLRLAATYWALDTDLARRRHFPAIHWTRSYSHDDLGGWFAREVAPDWDEGRRWLLAILSEEASLLEIVQLLGTEALGPLQHVTLRTGLLLREGFLQQSALDEADAYCPPGKQHAMLAAIRRAHAAMLDAAGRGVPPARLTAAPALAEVARLRFVPSDQVDGTASTVLARLDEELAGP